MANTLCPILYVQYHMSLLKISETIYYSDLANFAAVQTLESRFENGKDAVIRIDNISDEIQPVCRKTV